MDERDLVGLLQDVAHMYYWVHREFGAPNYPENNITGIHEAIITAYTADRLKHYTKLLKKEQKAKKNVTRTIPT